MWRHVSTTWHGRRGAVVGVRTPSTLLLRRRRLAVVAPRWRRVGHVGHTRLVGRRALEADAGLAGRRHRLACARCRDTGRRRHRRAEELQALRRVGARVQRQKSRSGSGGVACLRLGGHTHRLQNSRRRVCVSLHRLLAVWTHLQGGCGHVHGAGRGEAAVEDGSALGGGSEKPHASVPCLGRACVPPCRACRSPRRRAARRTHLPARFSAASLL